MRFFAHFLAVCLLTSVVTAQPSPKPIQVRQNYQDFVAPRLSEKERFKHDSQVWNTAKWTQNDAPYLKVRDAIDAAAAKGASMSSLAEKYKAMVIKKPLDRAAIFGWGYAAVAGRKTGIVSDPSEAKQLSLLSLAAPSSDACQYAHLQFIVASKWGLQVQLKPLASRLMKRNSNDYFVKYYWTRLLSFGSNAEKQVALQNAQELVGEYPRRASVCGLLADVYKGMFFTNRDISAGDKAIVEYQRFLRLASPNDPSRESAEYLIKTIKKWRNKLE